MTVKIDIYKAYDKIDLHFLRSVLMGMDFPELWIRLIMNCVTSVSYEVLINGSPQPQFKPLCDLCQGDPLSPFRFVLCMNVLSQALDKSAENRAIKGIRIARNAPKITHLLFADDAILFS